MRIRIYYNRQADMPRIWSFDLGTQETEVQVTAWRLYDVDGEEGHDFMIDPRDRDRPRVWIELKNVLGFSVQDEVLYVYGH